MSFSFSKALRRHPVLHHCFQVLRAFTNRVSLAVIGWIRRLPSPFSLGLASGFYSEVELLKQGKVAGRMILSDQGNFEVPPESMLALSGRMQHQMQPWPVLWTHHQEAEMVGSSLALINARGELSAEATYNGFQKHRFGLEDPAYFFPRLVSKPRRLEGNWTSLVSRWMPTSVPYAYGHWILDALPRLAALNEFPSDTGIIVPPFRLPYREESLRMLGVLDRCRWTTERHLRIEDYYFSSPPSMIACYNPYAIRWIRDTFLSMVADDPRPTPRRFFVRRRGDVRNITNEAEVLDFFADLGWEIVDSAELGFAEQIRYFSRAEAVCSIHGSGFTNVLWCPPGVRLLELFANSYLASDAEWIARCIPDAVHRHLIFPNDGRFNAIVDLDRVRRQLQLMDLL